VSTWTPDGDGLWLHGGAGSGKTSLIALLCCKMQAEGKSVIMVETRAILQRLARRSYGNPEDDHDRVLRRLAIADVLLLDDALDADCSRVEIDEFKAMLSARIGEQKPIVVTSNYDRGEGGRKVLERLSKNVDPAVVERTWSRLVAATGREVACDYPGDRRLQVFDKATAAIWKARRARQ